MAIPYDQLPESLRKRLAEAEANGTLQGTTKRKKDHAGIKSKGLPMKCAYCDWEFFWTSASGTPRSVEIHQTETGHARYSCVLS